MTEQRDVCTIQRRTSLATARRELDVEAEIVGNSREVPAQAGVVGQDRDEDAEDQPAPDDDLLDVEHVQRVRA